MASRNEVIGSGFSNEVKRQLKARENLFNTRARSTDQLLYMNANGAWVRLMSSVNTLTTAEVNLLYEGANPILIRGNKNLAYNNVLLGGASKLGKGFKSNIDTQKYHDPITVRNNNTVKSGEIKETLYNNYQSLGFRPTPGIESVSIESKNTYGTLREAEIKIAVHTLEDLEVMQSLYLRPGFSMFLEWGHTLWINQDGKLQKEIRGYNAFLQQSLSPQRIEAAIKDLREKSDYNYDAMHGYVKNFSWNFREDGGYDCTVTLVSKGSILESMAITFDPTNSVTTPADMFPKEKEKSRVERKSVFHKFFVELAKAEKKKKNTARSPKGVITLDDLDNKTAKDFKSRLGYFKTVTIPNLEMKDTGFWDNDDIAGQYVSFKTLLDLYNKFVAPMDISIGDELLKNEKRKLIQFYVGQTDTPELREYSKICKFITSDRHFSIDPLVCILPRRAIETTETYVEQVEEGGGRGAGSRIVEKTRTVTGRLGEVKNFEIHKKLEGMIGTDIKGSYDDILNIHLSIYYLTTLIDEIADSTDTSQQNMTTFLQRVLSGVNDVLGGVNQIDIFYDEDDNMFYLVDRKRTPDTVDRDDRSRLNLAGLGSIVTNLNVSSKISNEIAAQVSIAAQGTGNNYKENVEALLKWNSGLIDRHLISRSIKNGDGSRDTKARIEDERKGTWLKELKACFKELADDDNAVQFWKAPDYNKEGFNNLRSYHKEYCSREVFDRYFKGSFTSRKPIPGVIPVELSFDLIGIGGLKIGQAFTVARGILPKVYTTNFGFIITGLSHSIQDNKWVTSVKTQFFHISSPLDQEIEVIVDSDRRDAEGKPDPIVIRQPQDEILDDDPAPIINSAHIGAQSYDNSPLAKELRGKGYFNGHIPREELIFIGESTGASTYYINNGKPEYMLHPSAFKAWQRWRNELLTRRIPYQISSAYRSAVHQGGLDQGSGVAAPGSSPHGWGGVLDFSNLYRLVGGATSPSANLQGRKTELYKQIAESGKRYGFFNPWRLSDRAGTDELWHFEYWGPVN